MKTLLRLMLLLTFGAAGVGAACYLIVETPGPVASPLPRKSLNNTARRLPSDRKSPAPRLALPSPPQIGGSEIPATAVRVAPQTETPLPAVTQAAPQSSDTEDVSAATLLEVLSKFSEASERREQQAASLREAGSNRDDIAPAPEGAEAAENLPAPSIDHRQSRERKASIVPLPGHAEGDDHLSINIQDSDLREVLALLSEQGGLNILAGASVEGRVSATLNDVNVDAALAAILKSTGYAARREGKFIFVGTPQDFVSMRQSLDRVSTRIYRPNYVTAKDLQSLLTPLLSTEPTPGRISVSAPSAVGIAASDTSAGGDDFADSEAVLVQDYESVLLEIDQVVREIDQRPAQVAIEAMILSVKLNDVNKFGIDFQVLRDRQNVRFGSGTPRIDPLNGGGQVNPATGGTIGEFNFNGGGMKFAFLDDSLGVFINALETIGDTNVIATPKLMCLNKQRAEILIGAQLGYVNTTLTSTSTSQTVNFLEVGAQLRLRPFISNDGMIRMEIHPELSTGNVRVEGGFTLPDKELTQVTTNIMVPDGCTVIIGGLMREDLSTSTSQVPLMGSLPVVGPLFRSKTETIERREIIVLVTPRIVGHPEAALEGAQGEMEFRRRQAVYADQMTPLGKRYLGRKNLRKALDAFAAGNRTAALRLVNRSIFYDPSNRESIAFRAELEGDDQPVSATLPAGRSDEAGPLDGEEIAPWILDDLGQDSNSGSSRPSSRRQRGQTVTIERSGATEDALP